MSSALAHSVNRPAQYTSSRRWGSRRRNASTVACTRSGDAGTPAARNVRASPTTTPVAPYASGATCGRPDDIGEAVARDAFVVLAIFQNSAERACRRVRVESARAQCEQRLGPVQRLRDTGWLEQISGAQPLHGGGDR